MAVLSVHLLGPAGLTLDGQAVRTHSARTLALLTYLVLEPDRAHSRGALGHLLWEGRSETASRQGLRQALYSLRTVAQGGLGSSLQIDPDWVRWNPPPDGAGVDIDVRCFLADAHSTDPRAWDRAAQRYQAPLLDGLRLQTGEAFAEWLTTARERLHALAMQNLGRLVAAHRARSEWRAAAGHARAMLSFDPCNEMASRHLLQIHAAQGDAQSLDAEWNRLRRQLMQQLGVAPAAETAALHRTLLRRSADQPSADLPLPDQVAAGRGGLGSGLRALPPSAPEGDALLRAGQAAARLQAFSQALDLFGRALKLLQRLEPPSPARCCDALLLQEAMLERLGRRTEQQAVIDDALAIAEPLGDSGRIAAILLRRAGACAYLGLHDDARAAAGQALEIQRQLGDRPGQAEALRELGFVQWHAEDHRAALLHARAALDLHRSMGDVAGEASALHNLAEIQRGLGSPLQACQGFEQAVRLHWAARNPGGEILSLFGWARALHQAGDQAGSRQRYEAALTLSEQHGERVMRARALHALATLGASAGDLDSALAMMRQAIDVDRSIGYAHALGHDLVELGELHVRRGEIAQARVALQEALIWFDFGTDAAAQAFTHARLAELEGPERPAAAPGETRLGIKSHLPLNEGKVYCEFESPLAVGR